MVCERKWNAWTKRDFCQEYSPIICVSRTLPSKRSNISKIMSVDVLIVGGGSREHALAWKVKQSPGLGRLYVAPGNPGTATIAENVPIDVMEFEKLADFAQEKKIGLTIVGPDDPLGGGIVD